MMMTSKGWLDCRRIGIGSEALDDQVGQRVVDRHGQRAEVVRLVALGVVAPRVGQRVDRLAPRRQRIRSSG